jgi:hypothetical protein
MRVTATALALFALIATASGQEPDLESVVAKATQYASAYEQKFSLLVAEERYVVPAQMEESYSSKGDQRDITGLATYDKYRKFQVKTAETINRPPGL